MKRRADQALVDRGLIETRARAAALILAGKVYSGDRRVEKAGQPIDDQLPLTVQGTDHPWVSRGGVKLAHGLDHFGLSPSGRICLDIGASTGGFTDVLLSLGAERVHAVDVGHGQLSWKIRSDPRVVVHERTNARSIERAILDGDDVSVLVCDASFIGLRTLLPKPLSLLSAPAFAVALIKPQFEAGKADVGRGGVVQDPLVQARVCDEIAGWWAGLPGWRVVGITDSPITGPAGNREFLIAADLP